MTSSYVSKLINRISDGKSVRRHLFGGRLRIDRPLPFLLIYRRPEGNETFGMDRLVAGEASYLTLDDSALSDENTRNFLKRLIELRIGEFGAFLLVEIWAEEFEDEAERPEIEEDDERPTIPRFRIVTERRGFPGSTSEVLRRSLRRIRVGSHGVDIRVERKANISPPGMKILTRGLGVATENLFHLGLGIDPVWQNSETGEPFPLLFNKFRRPFARSLREAWYTFTTSRTTRQPAHYHALGPRAMTKVVWKVDASLAEINRSFDLLLALTPVNPQGAWQEFKRATYDIDPSFYYREVDIDPDLAKRELYSIPIERIEDPTIAHLFAEKREELDRRLTMLRDRGSDKLRYESMQLFGTPAHDLVRRAREVIEAIDRSRETRDAGGSIDAAEFAERVREEVKWYRNRVEDFACGVQVRDDISQGLLVSNGTLLIGAGSKFPKSRVDALIQHEVGTHLITWFNGISQPFQQLAVGLADYDEFQEGIAVLSEFLVGGLSHARLKVLAARVIAVDAMVDDATFVDTFRLLTHDLGIPKTVAFTITMRVYRGGGLTKDALYFRGLERVIDYFQKGGQLRPLFVGKIAARHLPIVRELDLRNVLHPVPLLPRYLDDEDAKARLDLIRDGMTVSDIASYRSAPRRTAG